MLRTPIVAFTLLLPIVALSACGGDTKKAPAKEEPKKEEVAKEEPKKEEEAAPKKSDKLELPWQRERVAGAMKTGTTLTYKLKGTDAKGGAVEDDYKCQVKKSDNSSVGTVCNTVNKPSKDKGAGMVATRDWSGFSPFFAVERPEHTLVRREEVTVPAGTFDAVVVDLKDFFGANYTVWMIADKPGIYAKVEEHARIDDEDKTNKTYELSELIMGE